MDFFNFRCKYLDVFSFAVSLSIYTWEQIENFPKNQLQFKQAAERFPTVETYVKDWVMELLMKVRGIENVMSMPC